MPFVNEDFKIVFTIGLFFFAMAFAVLIMVGEHLRRNNMDAEIRRCSHLIQNKSVMNADDRIKLCRAILK